MTGLLFLFPDYDRVVGCAPLECRGANLLVDSLRDVARPLLEH